MSGPNPPESESGAADPEVGAPPPEAPSEPVEAEREPAEHEPAEHEPAEPAEPPVAVEIGESTSSESPEPADSVGAGQTGETEAYSRAYSAPEAEHFGSAPYVPVDPRLYDYDGYGEAGAQDGEATPPRWPWIVGVTTIVAAIALVVSVALLVTRAETQDLATPAAPTTTAPVPATSTSPVQDAISPGPTPSAVPPPATTSEEPTPPPPPPSPEPETTAAPSPEPPPAGTAAPEPTPPPTTTAVVPSGPRQVTYTVTGTKAPFDQITITYIDASGQRRTQRNAYIPWSLTLTPISQSEVGSVEASSMLRLSKLNCTITSSDGTLLSSNVNDAPQTSC